MPSARTGSNFRAKDWPEFMVEMNVSLALLRPGQHAVRE
jgi:hypothetical protein